MSENEKLTRCETCRGTKRIIGLGLLEKQCPNCIGIGWVSSEPVDCKKSKDKPAAMSKKRGRPSKEVQEDLLRA